MGEKVLKIIFRVNFTDVDATTGMLTAYERDRKDKVWKGVSLKQNYIACKFIVNIGKSWKTHPEMFPNFQFSWV